LEQKKKDDEKAKLETLHVKQANMFGSFFKPKSKPAAGEKTSVTSSPTSEWACMRVDDHVDKVEREATPELSDYHQVFKPHVVRPGTKWATANRWAAGNTDDLPSSSSVSGSNQSDPLADHLRRHGGPRRTRKRKLPDGIKSGSPYPTVGEVWLAHQEAADPRKVLSQLKKNHKYPWKLLAFDQQARPPYSGTFTKRSAVVGPRTPFAQDPMFDYTYDSGDDWEEEEGGEDVDDSGEVKPEEEEEVDSDEEEEDEFDDWLDDTEDAGYAPGPGDDEDDPLAHAAPASRQERLQMNVVKKADKPRKVVKITPTWRGPIWETEIGEKNDFAEYRLQLLNGKSSLTYCSERAMLICIDTPDSIDPFTYTSSEPSQAYKTTMSTISMGPSTIPCLVATQATTIVPPVVSAAATPSVAPATAADSSTVKLRPSGPKIGFPTTHLSELYNLIHGNTKIKPDLVSQLRQQFENITSKAAIEAKVKEVAFREGKTKDSQWKVKPEAWVG
jgi:chromatin assembly factor 1 subunit A